MIKVYFLAIVVFMLLSGRHSPASDQADIVIRFQNSGQQVGSASTSQVAIADLDGDEDLDLYAANGGQDRVWLNDGSGLFVVSDFDHDQSYSRSVALSDMDGDGDIDAYVAGLESNRVWFNDGQGSFTAGKPNLIAPSSTDAIALGDLDGDTDIDAYLGNRLGANAPDHVWLNNGAGELTRTDQQIGYETSNQVSIGDIDGDRDLDVIVTTCGMWPEANQVWINDGSATFVDSLQTVHDTGCSAALGLADLDGDDDLDAIIGNSGSSRGNFTTWLNDGLGRFSKANTTVDEENHLGLTLGDLDNDGDPDLLFNYGGVWINDGKAGFSRIDQTLPEAQSLAIADLDGDGYLDVVLAFDEANQIWLNRPFEPNKIYLPFIGH